MKENYGRCARCGQPVRQCTCIPGVDFNNMGHEYFYENYFLISGEKPPALTSFQRQLLQACDDMKPGTQLTCIKGRKHGIFIILKCIEQKQLSQF